MAGKDRFFVSIQKKGKAIRSFHVASDEGELKPGKPPKVITTKIKQAPRPSQLNFQDVISEFKKGMEMYINFVPLLMSFGPVIWSSIASSRVEEYANAHGVKRDDLSSTARDVYELDQTFYTGLAQQASNVVAVSQSSKDITKIMIIGLISTYDYYLSQILRVVFNSQPKIIFNSSKNISYDDLVKYSSIEEARDAIIEKEVEGIIRESHQEQFRMLEEKFKMKLTEGLTVWPKFIEICERRNLFTHTGGVVSQQYIDKCGEGKCDISGVGVGHVLTVEPAYFIRAVQVVYEVGAKLGYVLWRKYHKEKSGDIDSYFNQICFDLINEGQFEISEAVLKFAVAEVEKRRGREIDRKMMIVNLANAIRLQKRQPEANAVLDREDWSASDDSFQISVAAVRGDVNTVAQLMKTIGRSDKMPPENYRDWPVFAGLRSENSFIEAFKEVFGLDFVSPKNYSLRRTLDEVFMEDEIALEQEVDNVQKEDNPDTGVRH